MVFSGPEIEQFIADGFVMLRGAFPREVAAECREFIWKQIGLWENCTSFDQPIVVVQKSFSGEPFDRVMNPRLKTALDELLGKDRFIVNEGFGWWTVLFPGFPGWGSWHVDGENYRHRLTSREQGLVPVFLFSDVGPGDGGTPLVRGSHHAVARLLAEAEPSGMDYGELNEKLPPVDPGKVTEVTGEAGDVAMVHPFLIHGFGPNRGKKIRFACNPQYQLKEPMNLDRPDGSYSPIEKAIRQALPLPDCETSGKI
jgi:Phytanoyl-CoA dioxygenase (PhyH)